jgi:hypothetical protein
MDAVSQRTRSKQLEETQKPQETQETQNKVIYEAENTENAENTETARDYDLGESIENRMDNYVGAMVYTAINYPRLFVAIWILALVVLSVLAVFT